MKGELEIKQREGEKLKIENDKMSKELATAQKQLQSLETKNTNIKRNVQSKRLTFLQEIDTLKEQLQQQDEQHADDLKEKQFKEMELV